MSCRVLQAVVCRVRVRVGGFTGVGLFRACLCPHCEVGNIDTCAWGTVCAEDLDRATRGTVRLRACPVRDRDIAELDAGPSHDGHAGPVLVDVKGVGIAVADEVLQDYVRNGAAAAV